MSFNGRPHLSRDVEEALGKAAGEVVSKKTDAGGVADAAVLELDCQVRPAVRETPPASRCRGGLRRPDGRTAVVVGDAHAASPALRRPEFPLAPLSEGRAP
jgi:hypothetical protein